MQTKKRSKSTLQLISLIWGIIFTLFVLLSVGPKVVITVLDDPAELGSQVRESFTTWFDPLAFCITYLIGYGIIWWKPLWGSIIILFVSVFYLIMGGLDGPPIFAVPGLLVGILYLIGWFEMKKQKQRSDTGNSS